MSDGKMKHTQHETGGSPSLQLARQVMANKRDPLAENTREEWIASSLLALHETNADLLEALKAMRSLVKEGGVPRYSVTPGAALNSVIEEIVDPALAKAEANPQS